LACDSVADVQSVSYNPRAMGADSAGLGEGAVAKRVRVQVRSAYPILEQGIRASLEASGDVEFVGSGPGELAPDVVVVGLGGRNGAPPLAADVVGDVPKPTGVVVLGPFKNRWEVEVALGAGALGCVSTLEPPEVVADAVRTVHAGRGYLSPLVAHLMVTSELSGGTRIRKLTGREQEILRLIADGKSNRTIAGELGLSVKTIHTHRLNVMAKLGVRTVSALVREAIRLGIVHA
jgi:DNA-binding NarL/FixJ family response regulator